MGSLGGLSPGGSLAVCIPSTSPVFTCCRLTSLSNTSSFCLNLARLVYWSAWPRRAYNPLVSHYNGNPIFSRMRNTPTMSAGRPIGDEDGSWAWACLSSPTY